jgi:hypothetical protein
MHIWLAFLAGMMEMWAFIKLIVWINMWAESVEQEGE